MENLENFFSNISTNKYFRAFEYKLVFVFRIVHRDIDYRYLLYI